VCGIPHIDARELDPIPHRAIALEPDGAEPDAEGTDVRCLEARHGG
jgi:hypothetical protein